MVTGWVMNFEGDKTALRFMIQFRDTPDDFAVNTTDAVGNPTAQLEMNPEYLRIIYLGLERGSGLDRDFFGVRRPCPARLPPCMLSSHFAPTLSPLHVDYTACHLSPSTLPVRVECCSLPSQLSHAVCVRRVCQSPRTALSLTGAAPRAHTHRC